MGLIIQCTKVVFASRIPAFVFVCICILTKSVIVFHLAVNVFVYGYLNL